MDRHIEARNLTILPEWEEKIDEAIARIETHHPGVVHHLRVCIIGTKHHRQGLFEVHVVASVPRGTIMVKEKGERVRPTIVASFDFLDRELREYDRKRQGLVKTHEGSPMGVVSEIFPTEGYGFIRSRDGDEVYFHRNALKDIQFEELRVGSTVTFGHESGEKGLQATWVRPR